MDKKILILQARPDEVSDFEFDAFLKYGKLSLKEVHRIRMEEHGIPSDLNLQDYSAVIVGGGPYNVTDAVEKKSSEQLRLEKDLSELLDEIIERDFPYFGACYGFGVLSLKNGGVMGKEKYAENVEALTISLTREGKADSLLKDLPEEFRAFAGHKESCIKMPKGATLLASSKNCPVHLYKIKNNIYGTQFHPELDYDGMCKRIDTYKDYGYFAPEDADLLKRMAKVEEVTVPMEILRRFVDKYRA